MFRAIVFDFDGTLVDSNSIKREGFFRVIERHGGSPTHMAEVLATGRGTRRDVFEAYTARIELESENDRCRLVDRLIRDYNVIVDSAVATAEEMPGASRLLEDIRRRGVDIYLSSATPIESLRRILANRGWEDRFDGFYGHPTSKVDALRDIMARTGYRQWDLAMVGDGEDDRASALDVGCAYFPVAEGRGTDRESERIYSLPELTTAFADWKKVR